MTYRIKIGKRLNIADINEMHNLVNWGNYTPEQWIKVKKQSTFMVQVIDNKKQLDLPVVWMIPRLASFMM